MATRFFPPRSVRAYSLHLRGRGGRLGERDRREARRYVEAVVAAYRIEVVGWKPKQRRATVNGRGVPLAELNGRWGVTVQADGDAKQVELR